MAKIQKYDEKHLVNQIFKYVNRKWDKYYKK